MNAYYEDGSVSLFHGDALAVTRDIPSGSVNCIVTSPPYYGLRDYGAAGQMGAEETVSDYVAGMVALFSELRRVLADDGTLWLNLGDSYGDGKQLIGVPWRVALALQADGWILRSDVIWAKPNPMPESVTDRPTKSHEYLFLLAKSPKYYYDADAIAEDAVKGAAGSRFDIGKTIARQGRTSTKERTDTDRRNKRTVWEIATVPFPGSHFAVYPPELIRPCILSGSRLGDTVLDPFSGSGTTGMVATQEGRKYIGIDLNSDYLNMSLKTRFAQPVLNLEGIGA